MGDNDSIDGFLWSNLMSANYQQVELLNEYQVRQPRVTAVAVSFGLIIALALFFFGQSLLISTGLWLLGMALVLIGYAFVSNYRFAIPVWDTAIAGQIIGFLGIGTLFLASILSS